jgi:N-glycosylase/DNA lyase
MQYCPATNAVRLESLKNLDPVKTFECGQCFRWNRGPDGSYTGVAFGKAARVWVEGGEVYISGCEEDYKNIWREYFDLSRDYAALLERLERDGYAAEAARYGAGIRLLRQDGWEALCSFIISQCNNIPRIKGIIEKLCLMYGDEISFENKIYYSFPAADRLAGLEAGELAPLKCGYRAPIIIEAPRAVASGALALDRLAEAGYARALSELTALRGVGKKVADCAILYGLHMQDAFPVDVWVKRALDAHYPKGFDPAAFGKAAGLVQQYIYYFIRSADKNKVGFDCNRRV